MSFFINCNNNQCKPSQICNNPTQGLCEKVLVEVTRVFDACKSVIQEQGLSLVLSDFVPAAPVYPLTFISAESDPANPATTTNVVITRLDNRPDFATVSGTLTIPMVVSYRDANGVLGTATANYTADFATVLFVPQPALTPVRINVVGQVSSTIGTISADGVLTTTICVVIIVKVVADVDILVPSYGYPVIPPCQTVPESVCPGLSESPTYPTARVTPTTLR
ncbi:MAG: hypothetical protein IJA69_02905 [Clostridia bacterium]|nr:hypothetical protein [Clostridia bacterium]